MIKNLIDLDRAIASIWDNYHMAMKDLEVAAATLDLNFDAVKRSMYENAYYDMETVTREAVINGLSEETIKIFLESEVK